MYSSQLSPIAIQLKIVGSDLSKAAEWNYKKFVNILTIEQTAP